MWISDKWQDFELIDCSKGEKLERWGKFYLVRPDSSRSTEGSGLGLSIARSLVQLQKGQLELTVDGDLFKVTLQFNIAE